MRLPSILLRRNKKAHKNTFGHALILAGSQRMLGAAALCSLSAARSGCGLVTLGIPKSLNTAAHKKISNVVMTFPLPETPKQTLSSSGFTIIKRSIKKYNCLAIGPGLSEHPSTQRLILNIIKSSSLPLVIDADGLNALAGNLKLLTKFSNPKILTPHPGELARLLNIKKSIIERDRQRTASDFAKKYKCVLLLKGHQTIVADQNGKVYVNQTGNAGLATAGSGDVLTGMIAALLAQGLSDFQAAKFGAYIHGKAGNLASRKRSKTGMIASDIIYEIPKAIKGS